MRRFGSDLTNTPTKDHPAVQKLASHAGRGDAAGLLSFVRPAVTPLGMSQAFARRNLAMSVPARQDHAAIPQLRPPAFDDVDLSSDVSSIDPTSEASPFDEALLPLSFDSEVKVQPSQGVDARARVLVLEGRIRDLQREKEQLRAAQEQLSRRPTTVTSGTQTMAHPMYGDLLIDLGFKRLYVASARTLVNAVPIWSRQRACNEGRVDEIVKAK